MLRRSLSLFREVYKAQRGIIPGELVEVFKGNPALLSTDWHEASAADAGRLALSPVG
jgi:hypothetical protein